MYITAGLTEGEQYKVSAVEVSGDTVLPKEEIEKMVVVKPDQIFSRRLLEISSDAITNTLGNVGYAFAKVNPIPDVDREKRTVAMNLQVVPGPRVNVRRIVFKGNTRTGDEVMRREMRQFEGSWYSQAAIDRSKVRLQRLGYFETVEVETTPVAGSNDQVDVVYNVIETTSGSFVFGLGYSQLSGLTTSIQLSQNNFLGSGNRIAVEAQRNSYLQRYAFSFTNPYFTDEGLSLGYNLSWREFDNSDFNTAQLLQHQCRRAGRAGPADHRDRHGLRPVRHRPQPDLRVRGFLAAIDRRLHQRRSASAPSTPGAPNWRGRATAATISSHRPAAPTSASRPRSRCPVRPSSTTSSTTSSPSTGRSTARWC